MRMMKSRSSVDSNATPFFPRKTYCPETLRRVGPIFRAGGALSSVWQSSLLIVTVQAIGLIVVVFDALISIYYYVSICFVYCRVFFNSLCYSGAVPRPGEISLAHNGVLFLDELPEFERRVLEALREPLETGHVTISRASHRAEFPARFQLIAAMNPCPCGHLGDPSGRCRCTPDQIARYRARLSGPLLDRIDLQVTVPPLSEKALTAGPGESSAQVRQRVAVAYAAQCARQGKANRMLEAGDIERHCPLSDAARTLLAQAMARLGLSARAYHRCLKVARTIADLAAREVIDAADVAEAVKYRRSLDGTGRLGTHPERGQDC